MDSSDWIDINRTVRISYTKKKFYNAFLFKMVYHVPGARLITYVKDHGSLKIKQESYNERISSAQQFYTYRAFHEPADLTQLTTFYDLYNLKSQDLKFRIESNNLMLYSNSHNELYKLATGPLLNYQHNLKEVWLIDSDDSLTLLDQGYTIVKKPTDYPYKVRLREGFQNHYERHGLATYLKNLGSEVKVSEYILQQLASNNKYFHGGYVYVADPKLIDMLTLVSPSVISTVNQLVTR